MVDKKQAIMPIFQENKKGIAIDLSLYDGKIGDLKKINYPNFKYCSQTFDIRDKETGEERTGIHFIEIINLPDNLIIEIVNIINNLVEDSKTSIKETIDQIFDYFKKYKLSNEIKNELLYDLGEATIILKFLNNDCHVMQYLTNTNNNITNFNINNNILEVRTSIKERNEFVLTYDELEEIRNKEIIICKFNFESNGLSILDIYDAIAKYEPLSPILVEKRTKWEQINEYLKDRKQKNDIINDYLIDIEKTYFYIFDNNKLPIIVIREPNLLKKLIVTIECLDYQLKPIDNLSSYFSNFFSGTSNKN